MTILDATLDSWERGNTVLRNLVRALPEGGLAARALLGSPTVAEMFAHLCYERLVSVRENAPEQACAVPAEEWDGSLDAASIVARLDESGRAVRDAVRGRVAAERGLDEGFAHPVQLLHFLIFHEGYHHGQIKLALKAMGAPLADDVVGPLIWDVWRAR